MAEGEQKVRYPEGDDALLPAFLETLTVCQNDRRKHDEVSRAIDNLVANEYDWHTKLEWQSKVALPTFPANVERFAAIMQEGMVQAQTFFGVKTKEWSPLAKYAAAVHKWIDFRLDRLKFKQKFADGCKTAAIWARMWFKPHYAAKYKEVLVWPREETPVLDADGNPQFDPITLQPLTTVTVGAPYWEPRVEFDLDLPLIEPRLIWKDPTGRGRFIIHEYKIDYGELLKLAEEGHYELDEVKKLAPAPAEDAEQESMERERRDHADEGEPPSDKAIVLHEFWGDLYDTEGRLVSKNCTFTVANRQVIVRHPVKNPYWHGKLPFVSGAPVTKPFSNYDKSFLRDAMGIQVAQTEFVNLTLDAAKLAVAPPTTLDIDLAYDPNDYKSGLYPGKVIKVRGSWSNGQQPLNTMRLNPIDPMVPSVVSLLDRENQRATGVNDLMQGLMPARRATASEGAMRLNESGSLFATYARNLEWQLFPDLIEQIWALDLQYFDWSDPCAEAIMGPEFAGMLRNMTPEERYRLIEHFEFRGEGLSAVISKQQELATVDMWFSRAGRYPIIGQRVNIDYLLEKAAEASGWNPQRVLNPPGQMNMVPGKGPIPQVPTPKQMMQGGPPQGGSPALPPQVMVMAQQMMGGVPNG